ncbi:hypothetical protein JXB11_01035 [Candidatus Woesearchaeota archaeon]|nr:hypothetical protein [Candidatus Woesearchaeota archaeon]
MPKKRVKYHEGYFIGMWMAICAPLGIPIGLFIGGPAFIGAGVALGVSIGLAIGAAIEAEHRKAGRIRPLTKEEERRKKISVFVGVIVFLIGALVAVLMLVS